jgi:hypothetical protein
LADPINPRKDPSADQPVRPSGAQSPDGAMMTNPIYARLARGRRKRGSSIIQFVIAAAVVVIIAAIGLYFLTGPHNAAKAPVPAPPPATSS